MRFWVIFVLFFSISEIWADAAVTTTLMSMTAADSLDRLSVRKKKGIISSFLFDNEFELKKVMIVTKADMNNSGAMKVHLVIVYERELMKELGTMSAYRYFSMVDQLIKDYPDKMKIYAWDLIAEDRIRNWEEIDGLNSTMTPLGGFVFADYQDNMGTHRARIPNYEKVKIIFERSDFKIEYEDKSLNDDGSVDEDDLDEDEGGLMSWFD